MQWTAAALVAAVPQGVPGNRGPVLACIVSVSRAGRFLCSLETALWSKAMAVTPPSQS